MPSSLNTTHPSSVRPYIYFIFAVYCRARLALLYLHDILAILAPLFSVISKGVTHESCNLYNSLPHCYLRALAHCAPQAQAKTHRLLRLFRFLLRRLLLQRTALTTAPTTTSSLVPISINKECLLRKPFPLISHHFRSRFWLSVDWRNRSYLLRSSPRCGASARGISPKMVGKPERKNEKSAHLPCGVRSFYLSLVMSRRFR